MTMDLLTVAQALAHLVSDVLLICEPDGTVWLVSPRLERTLGCPMERAIRQPLWEVLVSIGPARERTRDVEDTFRRVAQQRGDGDTVHWSPQWVSLQGPGGRVESGWLTVLPLGRRAEHLLVVFSTTETHRGSALWRSLLDTVDEPLVVLDRRLRIWELNDAARRMLADGRCDPRGMPCYQAFHAVPEVPDDCPLPEAFRMRKPVTRTIAEPGTGATLEVTCWPLLDDHSRPALVVERLRILCSRDGCHGAGASHGGAHDA